MKFKDENKENPKANFEYEAVPSQPPQQLELPSIIQQEEHLLQKWFQLFNLSLRASLQNFFLQIQFLINFLFLAQDSNLKRLTGAGIGKIFLWIVELSFLVGIGNESIQIIKRAFHKKKDN